MPLNFILRKWSARYKLSKLQEKINHLMYMAGIKLFAKNKKRIANPYTDRENIQSMFRFGMRHRKCFMLVMKNGKQQNREGIKLPNQEKVRTLEEKETYKYFGILEGSPITQVEMREKIKKSLKGE